MSIELDDNVNTSVKYLSESSKSVEQVQFEQAEKETRVPKSTDEGIDSHVEEWKIQGNEMNIPGIQKGSNRNLILNPEESSRNSFFNLVSRLKTKFLPNPILNPKPQLKVIGVPSKVSSTPDLQIFVNKTDQYLVDEVLKENDIAKASEGNDVDYTQLEGAMQGFQLNSKQKAALRKSWRSACDKQAAKKCIKACKGAASVQNSKDFKKLVKKACKTSCRNMFNVDDHDEDGPLKKDYTDYSSGSDCGTD